MGWATAASPRGIDVPGAPGFVFADTVSRFVAYLLDGILLTIAVSLLAGLIVRVIEPGRPSEATQVTTGILAALWFAFLSLGYSVYFWAGGRRATPGQMLFKIQVGNAFDGRPLTVTQAVRRWFGLGTFLSAVAILPALTAVSALVGIVWTLVLLVTTVRSPTKQGLHDRFANSAVVRPRDASSRGVATACLVVLGIVVAMWVFAIVALIFLGGQVSTILSSVGDSI